MVLPLASSHWPWSFVHCHCSRLALNQGLYCHHAAKISPSSEFGSPTSAKLRNALLGSRDSCHSPTSHSSSHGHDSASAGVLFFPATWRILKL